MTFNSETQCLMIGRIKVSIVIPIFETEKYLRKCLESVVNQSFRDIEILCVDDKTTDASVEIVKEFSRHDPRVRLIVHESNLGLGGARNTGIQHARADLVMGVDSDDYIHPDMVKDMYDCLVLNNADVVECGYAEVDEEGTSIVTYSPFKGSINVSKETDIFGISAFAFWNKMFKRDLYIKNDIWFPNKLYYEDLATTPRIFTKVDRIAYIGDIRYFYVQRSGSITNTIKEKNLLDYIKVFDIIKKHLYEIDWYEDQRENVLRTIQVNFDFIKKKIMLSDDPYKMNLLRYADFIERAYRMYSEQDEVAIALNQADVPEAVLIESEKVSSIGNVVHSDVRLESLKVAILSRASDDEAVTRMKIGAFRSFLKDRVSFFNYIEGHAELDGLLINHLDAIEGMEDNIREFRKKYAAVPIIALVSDFYPRVREQIRRFYDIIDVVAVPTDEIRDSMKCYTDAEVVTLPDPIDFQLVKSLQKKHLKKHVMDVVWFGYPESFEKSMLEFSPLLEYYHSIRRIRYHIITDTARFRSPCNSLTHAYKSRSFLNILPMFDVCVTSHSPNDFQLATYIKSENKAVLSINRGVPVIASKTPSYERMFREVGLSDFLFTTRKELEKLLFKMEDESIRNNYLETSQSIILDRYSPQRISERWWEIFLKARRGRMDNI